MPTAMSAVRKTFKLMSTNKLERVTYNIEITQSFTLFSLAVSAYLVYGLVAESRPNLEMNIP